jgi:hypothetical protein
MKRRIGRKKSDSSFFSRFGVVANVRRGGFVTAEAKSVVVDEAFGRWVVWIRSTFFFFFFFQFLFFYWVLFFFNLRFYRRNFGIVKMLNIN